MRFATPRRRTGSVISQTILRCESLEARTLLSANDVFVDVDAAAIVETESALSNAAIQEIQSLGYGKFKNLSAEEIVHLTDEQIASIPNDWYFKQISPEARAALTTEQVQSLNIAATGIRYLTNDQIDSLLPAQVASIAFQQIRYVTVSQVEHLSPTQLGTIQNDWYFRQVPAEIRGLLDADQVAGLNVQNIGLARLTSEQISWLTVEQITSLDSDTDFWNLLPENIVHLTPDQVSLVSSDWSFSRIPNEARAELVEGQVQGLNTTAVGIRRLTPQQIDWLTVEQIVSLDADHDFWRLTPEKITHLTADQMAIIPNEWSFKQISSEARAALAENQVQAIDVMDVGIRYLNETQIGWLTTDQITSLDSFYDFWKLSSENIVHLTADQIQLIPNSWAFAQIPGEVRASLTQEQIHALNVAEIGIRRLTSDQIGWLSESQIQTLSSDRDFWNLSTENIVHLSADQLKLIPNDWSFGQIPSDVRSALTQTQIVALDVGNLGTRRLTAEQIGWLSADQIQTLKSDRDFWSLSSDNIVHLSVDQIATIPNDWSFKQIAEDARAALTTDQVQAINVAEVGIHRLTPEQINWLTSEQIVSLQSDRDFWSLSSDNIVHLSAEQIASIGSDWSFKQIPSDVRSSLTEIQVQALDVGTLGLSRLTTEQVEQLTVEQVQSLIKGHFRYLTESQIVHLSPDQLYSIDNDWIFTRISTDVRSTLTHQQVAHLNTAAISISNLTGEQRLHLTTAQIQMLNPRDFRYLTADQAKLLTVPQMSSISDAGHFLRMSDEARASLSREQLLNMQAEVSARAMKLPTSFVGESDVSSDSDSPAIAEDGLAGDNRTIMERNYLFSLVPLDAVTHSTIASGSWSDAAIWSNGQVPGLDADVLVSPDTVVTFDAIMTEPIDTLRIDGTLQFDTQSDTQLSVDTIVVHTDGVLHVGTEENPIDDDVAARIVFDADDPIDTTWDPKLMSRGLLTRGEVRMFGEDVTPFVAVQTHPERGDTELILSEVPVNWQIGDRLVLTGTNASHTRNHDEELVIESIAGNIVTLDRELQHNHIPPEGYGLSVYVANVNRNVVLLSENPDEIGQRGHVMMMHNPDVQIENAGFYGLGRTDKRNPINDSVVRDGQLVDNTGLNPRARYSLHFHRTGVDPKGLASTVQGSAVVDSPGWGFVNHSSFVHFEDNVAFHVVGASYATEDGDEIGSFQRNISIKTTGSGDGIEARRDIHDFGHNGHGFWFQGPGVDVVDNITAGNRDAAFVFFTASQVASFDASNLDDINLAGGRSTVSVGNIPLKTVRGNTAFASKNGLETWFHLTHMNDGQSYIEDFTSWNTRGQGMFTPYTGRTTISDSTLIGNKNRPSGTGINRNNVTNNMTYQNLRIDGFNIGISAPVNGQTTVTDGHFETVQAINVQRAHDSLRVVVVNGNPNFVELNYSQLDGRAQYDIFLSGDLDPMNHDLETYFSPDVIKLGTVRFNNHQVYYHEQAADFVPFPSGQVPNFIPTEVQDKSNADLWNEFGIATAGAVAPDDAVEVERINGLVGSRTDYPVHLELLSRKYTNELTDYVLTYENEFGDPTFDDGTKSP